MAKIYLFVLQNFRIGEVSIGKFRVQLSLQAPTYSIFGRHLFPLTSVLKSAAAIAH